MCLRRKYCSQIMLLKFPATERPQLTNLPVAFRYSAPTDKKVKNNLCSLFVMIDEALLIGQHHPDHPGVIVCDRRLRKEQVQLRYFKTFSHTPGIPDVPEYSGSRVPDIPDVA